MLQIYLTNCQAIQMLHYMLSKDSYNIIAVEALESTVSCNIMNLSSSVCLLACLSESISLCVLSTPDTHRRVCRAFESTTLSLPFIPCNYIRNSMLYTLNKFTN